MSGKNKSHLVQRCGYRFEINEKNRCNFCEQEHVIKSGPDEDPNAKKSRGGQASVFI